MSSRNNFLNLGVSTLVSAMMFLSQSEAAWAGDTVSDASLDHSSESRVSNPEEIIVSGKRDSLAGGMMKRQTAPEAISSITAEGIALKMPATSALQVVATMPGVNFGTSDAYGMAARNFISVRGLDETEIGWMLEGMPAVDQANFFPFTETWADNENVADITFTAGNSRLQDPIVNATGGEFIMAIRSPDDDMGARLSASLGSFDARRGFASIDTGYIGKTGIKTFLSYSRTEADNFIGYGRNKRDHIDFKAEKEWAPGVTSSLFGTYSEVKNARIAPITLANFNIAKESGNFNQFTYSDSYPATGSTNYYKAQGLTRETLFLVNNNSVALSDRVTLHVAPYFRYIGTLSHGATSLLPTSIYSGNSLVTPAYTPDDLQSGRLFIHTQQKFTEYSEGVNSYLEYNPTDTNHMMLGYWYDRWDLRIVQRLFPFDASGNIEQGAPLLTTEGDLITGSNYRIGTDTSQFFMGDTQSFFDNKLKLTAGFKYLIFHISGNNDAIGPQDRFSLTVRKFLPRAALSYDISNDMQLYANVTRNARMPLPASTYVDIYNVGTGRRTVTGNFAARPESSWGEQVGFRYYGAFNLDLNAFNMKLKNRQIQGQQFINGVNTSQVISAGDETIRGISGEASTRKYHGFSFYVNGQYLYTRFDDNIPSGADFLPTKGKTMVLSPKWMAGAGINYDSGGVFASATYKYVGSQFSTFVNDESIPSYNVVDLVIGYRMPDFGFLKGSKISANFNNLVSGKYLGISQSPTGNSFAVRGVNGTTIAGSKPTYYLSAPFAAMVTLSTAF